MSQLNVAASIPSIHALYFLTLLERWSIDTEALVRELSLSREALAQPGARISIPVAERLIARGRELTGDSALGFYLGWQMRISAHGFLGFAAMTSATTRAALQVAVRFAPTHTDAISLQLEEGPEYTSLIIAETADLGSAREFIISALMVGIWQIGNSLTGQQLEGNAEVAYGEPADYARIKHLLPSPIRFDRPDNRLTFHSAVLDLPLLLADPAALQLAREQCERDLDALASARSLVDRVRQQLVAEDHQFRTIHEVARALYMSDRTLKRKLMSEGTSYFELLDTARKERALLLLRDADLTLEQVADRVGYSELSNFTRAFKRWTGTTPKRFRS
jgi:AraC-like DNA-binding protein